MDAFGLDLVFRGHTGDADLKFGNVTLQNYTRIHKSRTRILCIVEYT